MKLTIVIRLEPRTSSNRTTSRIGSVVGCVGSARILAGAVPVPGQVVYAGTKFAVVGMSTAMADEFAPHGVHVSVVMPPFTATDLIFGNPASDEGTVQVKKGSDVILELNLAR